MVLEPNVSPHRQIKDDDVKECISIEVEIKTFHFLHFLLHNHLISLNSIHTTPKMVHACMHTFGPKPHLLAKYHIVVHLLFTVFDLC